MKPGELFKALTETHSRFTVSDVDGVMWANVFYWAVAVPDANHVVARMLAEYNLPLAPCVLDIGRTLKPADTDTPPPDVAGLLAKLPDDLAKLEPHSINGAPLFCRDGQFLYALLVHPSGGLVAFNVEYLETVEELTPDGDWFGEDSPSKAIARMVDGKVVGLLMPVRCPATDRLPEAVVR